MKVYQTITDLEGVLVSSNTSRNLLGFLIRHHYIEEGMAAGIEKAVQGYKAGNVEYLVMASIMEQGYLSAFEGKRPGEVGEIMQDFFRECPIEKYPYTEGLVERLLREGPIIGVTNTASEAAPRLGEELGIGVVEAPSRFELREGLLVPRKLEDWPGWKEETTERYMEDGKPFAAAGDAITDVPMLERASVPMVFHPDPGIVPMAEAKGWPVVTAGGDDRVLHVVEGLLS